MMSDEPFARHRAFISSSASAPTFPTFTSPAAAAAVDSRSPSPNPTPLRPSPSSSSAASRNRLHSSPSFAYNARVALALAPAAAFLLDLGGVPVLSVVAAGLLLTYLFDSLSLKSAAFFTVWFSLVAAQLAFFFSASLHSAISSLALTALALFLCAETTFLVGVWASLQFRWIQIENPSIVVALERLLFACIPVAVPALFTWAVVSALGMSNAAYYFMAFSCIFYWLFSLPRPSSYRSGKQDSAAAGDSEVLGPLESCLHTLYLLFVPLLPPDGSSCAT